jgi:hypothetical protein
MKKFKFFLIAVLFAGGVTAAFAFNHKPVENARFTTSWFQYTPLYSGGASNPDNYVKVGSEPTCEGSGALCAIEAPVLEGDAPDLENIMSQRNKTP